MMPSMSWYKVSVVVLFGLFVIANGAYLQSVPGLLGDEGSEGENVFELLDSKKIAVMGERSYIGPLIDYVRVPFVKTFGYSVLAMRLPMFIASLLTFWLAAAVLKRLFGKWESLFALSLMFFSPVYILYQRFGWTITLFPFFAFLLLYLLTLKKKNWLYRYVPLLAGLAAGIGLSNHIVFLPTLAAVFVSVVVGALVFTVLKLVKGEQSDDDDGWFAKLKEFTRWWTALVGFWAGFGMQFAVLVLFKEDQGDAEAVASLLLERLAELPKLLPMVVSGSAFSARYVGNGYASLVQWGIALAVVILAVVALVSAKKRLKAWLWAGGLSVQVLIVVYMTEQFSLRYFVVGVLGLLVLAGVGIGTSLSRWAGDNKMWKAGLPAALALLLMVWTSVMTLGPFLKTGGSVNEFELVNLTENAYSLVDHRPLVECLRGAGNVTSESPHIYNRLRYLSHSDVELKVVGEENIEDAKWLVHYKIPENVEKFESGRCDELKHFIVQER